MIRINLPFFRTSRARNTSYGNHKTVYNELAVFVLPQLPVLSVALS
jgi:hypothetical protein